MINCELVSMDIQTGGQFEDIIMLVAGNNCNLTFKSHPKMAALMGVA